MVKEGGRKGQEDGERRVRSTVDRDHKDGQLVGCRGKRRAR